MDGRCRPLTRAARRASSRRPEPRHGAFQGTPPKLTYRPFKDAPATDGFAYVAKQGAAASPPVLVGLLLQPASKTTCLAPDFGIQWTGYDSFKLIGTADPPQSFVVTLCALESGDKKAKLGVPRCQLSEGDSTDEGARRLSIFSALDCPDGVTTALEGETVRFCMEASAGGSAALVNVRDRKFLLASGGLLGFRYEALPGERSSDCAARNAGPPDPSIKLLEKHSRGFDLVWSTTTKGTSSRTRPRPRSSPAHLSRLGFVLGAGFSTVPGENVTEVKTRYYGGFRINVEGFNQSEKRDDHLQNARGNVQLDYAWDDLYERVVLAPASVDGTVPAVLGDESKRLRLTGEIELPRVGNKWLRIILRAHASIPASGDGPSDIRVSALASIDPREWFGGVGKASSK